MTKETINNATKKTMKNDENPAIKLEATGSSWASERTKKLTKMAMLTALSLILLALIHIPLFPAAPWLEYDMADVPILLSTFLLGPAAGLQVLAVVCLLQVILFAGNGVVGFIMHFCATGIFIVVASFLYSKIENNMGMIIGLIFGSMAMVAMMVPMNLIFTVHFFGTPKDVVLASLIPVIIPFNLIKAGLNSIIFFCVYKVVKKVGGKMF